MVFYIILATLKLQFPSEKSSQYFIKISLFVFQFCVLQINSRASKVHDKNVHIRVN